MEITEDSCAPEVTKQLNFFCQGMRPKIQPSKSNLGLEEDLGCKQPEKQSQEYERQRESDNGNEHVLPITRSYSVMDPAKNRCCFGSSLVELIYTNKLR